MLELLTVRGLALTFAALELFALLSVPSVLLRRRGRPTAATAWILALFALPALGGLLWWAFGRTRIDRKRRKQALTRLAFAEQREAPTQARGTAFDRLLPERSRGEFVFTTRDNRVQLLEDGTTAFPALAQAIEQARRSVNVLFFTFEYDDTGQRFVKLLADKARAGLTVRVLVDGFGSHGSIRRLRRALEPHGVEFAVFLPSRLSPLYAPRINFANHRKIVVVDGGLAFTGGMNLAVEYERRWRDLMLRIEGHAARCLNHVLLEDWFFATGCAVDDDPVVALHEPEPVELAVVASGPDSEPWIHDAYFLAITRAERSVLIATPYFIPTSAIVTALRTAAGRGVQVCIVVPGESDVRVVKWASRSFYRELVSAGVRIYEYGGPMLHAKALVCDGAIACVGTANIDSRSFRLSFEVSCFCHDRAIGQQLSRWIEELLRDSEEVTLEGLEHKPLGQKLAESAAHLLSPML